MKRTIKKESWPTAFQDAESIPSNEDQESRAQSMVEAFCSLIGLQFGEEEGECRIASLPIAGVSFRYTKADYGIIQGVTFPDKNSPIDKTAIGLMAVDSKGSQKLLGYVPKDRMGEFNFFAKGQERVAFIGYIVPSALAGVEVRGEVKLFIGKGQEMRKAMQETFRNFAGIFAGYLGQDWLEDLGQTKEEMLHQAAFFYRL